MRKGGEYQIIPRSGAGRGCARRVAQMTRTMMSIQLGSLPARREGHSTFRRKRPRRQSSFLGVSCLRGSSLRASSLRGSCVWVGGAGRMFVSDDALLGLHFFDHLFDPLADCSRGKAGSTRSSHDPARDGPVRDGTMRVGLPR